MADSKLTIVTRLPNEILRSKVDSFVKAQKLAEPGYSMNTLVVDAIRAWIEPTTNAAPPVLASKTDVASIVPRPKPKGWMAELLRLKSLGEVDPEEASREEAAALQGFRQPKAWHMMDLHHRAAYLDANFPKEGTIPEESEAEITKHEVVYEMPKMTRDEILAAFPLVRLGIPKPSKPPSEPEPAGTAAPEAGIGEVDGW